MQTPTPNQLRLQTLAVQTYARQLRMDVRSTSDYFTNVPTDGISCNLLALIDVWELEQMDALNSQLTALAEPVS